MIYEMIQMRARELQRGELRSLSEALYPSSMRAGHKLDLLDILTPDQVKAIGGAMMYLGAIKKITPIGAKSVRVEFKGYGNDFNSQLVQKRIKKIKNVRKADAHGSGGAATLVIDR